MTLLLAIAQFTYRKLKADRILLYLISGVLILLLLFCFPTLLPAQYPSTPTLVASTGIDILAIYIGSHLLATDSEDGSFYYFLSKPLSRDEYLLGKYLGGAAMLLTLFFLPLSELMVVDYLYRKGDGILSLITVMGLNFSISLAFLSLALYFSVKKYTSQTLTFLIILLSFSFLPRLLPPGPWSSWLMYYPGAWRFSAYMGKPSKEVILGVIVGYLYALLFLVFTFLKFRRQELA